MKRKREQKKKRSDRFTWNEGDIVILSRADEEDKTKKTKELIDKVVAIINKIK